LKFARHLLGIAAALVLVITTASAYLRLSQYGLGCADWPACYGKTPLEPAMLPESSAQFWVRAIHRVTATIAGLVFVAIAVFCWDRWRTGRERVLSFAPLLLAAFLAWLGRYTPSTLPAVTLGNLVGGMATLGVLWWLRVATAPGYATGPAASHAYTRAAALTLLVLFVQIALGGLTSARLTAAACPGYPLCDTGTTALSAAAFNPFAHVSPAELGEAALRGLQLVHRGLGALVTVLLAVIGMLAIRRSGPVARRGAWLLALAGAQLLVAATMILARFPLPLAVAHNFLAALLVMALIGLIAARRT